MPPDLPVVRDLQPVLESDDGVYYPVSDEMGETSDHQGPGGSVLWPTPDERLAAEAAARVAEATARAAEATARAQAEAPARVAEATARAQAEATARAQAEARAEAAEAELARLRGK